MKGIVLLCLLAVYSAQAMPNMEDVEQMPVQNVPVKSYIQKEEEEEEEDGVNSRVKRENGDSEQPPNNVDVDVGVNINVPEPVNVDVDVDVNINAEDEDEENGSVTHQPRTAACDCTASLKQQAADLANEGNQLLNTLQELKAEATANNGTAIISPKSSEATAIVTQLEQNVEKTAGKLTRAWHYYCYWKYYYFWFWSWRKYVCDWYWVYGRKKRTADLGINEDEEPICITSDLDVTLAEVDGQIAVATVLKDIVINDRDVSEFVLSHIDQVINMLTDNLPFINELSMDLNDLPC